MNVRIRANLIVENANELVTVAGGPRTGQAMRDLGVIEGGSVAAMGDRIVAVGTSSEVRAKVDLTSDARVVDASGKVVLPGLVDSHTHLVFAGSRENEFIQRAEGRSYMDILASGGGILSTVRATRAAPASALVDIAMRRLDAMLCYGTTTVEVKSGYGLSLDEELKCLRVARELAERHPMDIVATFLGAHAVPPEYRGDPDGYVLCVIEEIIPRVASDKLAEFCDVFCEEGVFSVEQSRRVLEAGKAAGLAPKLHADEIAPMGGAELASEVGAASADHLLCASLSGIRRMAEAGVVATLLPATSFTLMLGRYADARAFIDAGCHVALATDFNPGTSPTLSMQFVMNLAALGMRLHPAEVICACTINAAHALGRSDEMGSIEVGKFADIIVADVDTHLKLPYQLGTNFVDKVIKRGQLVVSEGRRVL
ncbi:MAG: imidazolonepropionase [Firmicutes bacterium]|jgi:imidazolonepropionase|nr:imidazolonepropionase [Bacillota bacterium]MDH7495327.1 imidazolonepropionase [Bacillota bacterium]